MSLSSNSYKRWNLLTNTFYFFKIHFVPIIGLGLVASFGRVIQLGGFGEISTLRNIILEAVAEAARITLFLYVLGLANLKKGVLRIKYLFTHKGESRELLAAVIHRLKKEWLSVCLNIVAFLLIAWTINYLIDLTAYETCLYLKLKDGGILVESSSEWTILLFFKNLTVIPLTLIFDTILLLWLSNKLADDKKIRFQ